MPTPTNPCANPHVIAWIKQSVDLCKPDKVVYLDGSKEELNSLYAQGVKDGVFIKLNEKKWPGCYYHRSNSNDVARTEHLTFICTPNPDTVGPTNNYMNDVEAKAKLSKLYDGSMKGRTMYVIPFVMGPIGSPLAKVGVELTDSVYVAASMSIMTRVGLRA
jgi:phosphoenolpyruvate carboxykinase (GTP)